MKLFRFKNFVRTCAFAIAALLTFSASKALAQDVVPVNIEPGTDGISAWTKGWTYSQSYNSNNFSWLNGDFTRARTLCYGNGKVFVTDKDNKILHVVDSRTGEKLYELTATNIPDNVNGYAALSDVRYFEGSKAKYVFACNMVTSTSKALQVYRWKDDGTSSNPEIFLTTKDRKVAGRWGDGFYITGDPDGDGKIWFVRSSSNSSNSSVIYYKITNGVCTTTPNVTTLPVATTMPAKIVPISDTQFWVDDLQDKKDVVLYEWVEGGTAKVVDQIKYTGNEALNTGRGNDIAPFSLLHSDQQYAFITDQENGSTSWKNANALLLKKDATNGWKKIDEFAGLGENTNGTNTSVAYNLINYNGVTIGAELWYCTYNQGMAYYYCGELTPPTLEPVEPVEVLEPKKREMRSAWLTSVFRIDWPVNYGTGTEKVDLQKKELDAYLDAAQKANLNSICFQVRPMCDALYESSYEPWSRFVSGKRGTSPGWDPLAYMVEECHKRGLRLAAWVNPYRYASKGEEQYATTERDAQLKDILSMISIKDPKNQGKLITILNPGKQTTIDHIVKVCKEIITKYNVDGLIFDDYFYPDGITKDASAPDYKTWQESGTSMSIGDWRRANVNRMVAAVYNMVKAERPDCTFGISPAGVACTDANVAKNHGVTPMTGLTDTNDWQYDGIYSDPVQWLKTGTIDYVSPQIYWPLNDAKAPFGTVTKWWNDVAKQFGRHHYASHYNTSTTVMTPGDESTYQELLNEVETNRSYNTNNTPGSIFYSAKCLKLGTWGDTFRKYCADNIYKYKAIPPVLTWKNKANYSAPANFTNTDGVLSWNKVSEDKLCHYAVYAVPSTVSLSEFKDSYNDARSKYLLDLTYNTSYTLASDKLTDYWYAVTAIDAANNEYDVANIGAPDYAVSGLSFTSERKNDVDYKYDSSKGIYTFTTTGGDPFVFTTALAEDLSAGKCVLEFEYVSSGFTGGDQLQLFFGNTLSEARSSKHDGLQNTNTWTTYTVNIANQRTQFNWGKTGEQIRFDWGAHTGVTIMVKNLRIREMTAEEKANFEYVEQPIGDLAGLGYFHKKGENGLWYFRTEKATDSYNNRDYVVLKSFDNNYTKYEGIPDKYFLKWIMEDNSYNFKVWYVRKSNESGTISLPFWPAIQKGSIVTQTDGFDYASLFDVSTGFKTVNLGTDKPAFKLVLLPVAKNTDTSAGEIAPVGLDEVTEIDWSVYGKETDSGETTDDKKLGTCYLYGHVGVNKITGIGYFTGLKKLNISRERYGWYQTNSNYALTIDGKQVQFSSHSVLNDYDSKAANMAVIDFSHNTALEEINFAYNDLKYLDVSCLPNLKKLNLSNNSHMETLDISHNPLLEELRVEHCFELKHIDADLANNKAMKYLQIFDTMYGWDGDGNAPNNTFQTDIVDNMPNLEVLHAFANFFDKLDVTGLKNLKSLWIHNSVWGTRQNAKGNWLHKLDLSQNLELRDVHVHNMHLSNLNINSPYIGEDYGYEPEREIIGDNTPGLEANNNYRRITADLGIYPQKDGSYQYIYYLRTATNEQTVNDKVLNDKEGAFDVYRYKSYSSDADRGNADKKDTYLVELQNTLADDGFDQSRASNWRLAEYSESNITTNGVYLHSVTLQGEGDAKKEVLLPVINSNMASKEDIVNHDYIAEWYNSAGFSPKSARGEIVVLKWYRSPSLLSEWPSEVSRPQSICYDYDLMGDALKAAAKEGKRKVAVTNPDKYKATFYLDIVYPILSDGPTEILELDLSEKEVSHVTYTDLAGRVSNRPFSGVNIVTTHYTDGTSKVIKQIKR